MSNQEHIAETEAEQPALPLEGEILPAGEPLPEAEQEHAADLPARVFSWRLNAKHYPIFIRWVKKNEDKIGEDGDIDPADDIESSLELIDEFGLIAGGTISCDFEDVPAMMDALRDALAPLERMKERQKNSARR